MTLFLLDFFILIGPLFERIFSKDEGKTIESRSFRELNYYAI